MAAIVGEMGAIVVGMGAIREDKGGFCRKLAHFEPTARRVSVSR
jgi:hypothetical protein